MGMSLILKGQQDRTLLSNFPQQKKAVKTVFPLYVPDSTVGVAGLLAAILVENLHSSVRVDALLKNLKNNF
jgi:hypothetical protein